MKGIHAIDFSDLLAKSDNLGRVIYEETSKHGYVLISNAHFGLAEGDTIKQKLLDFCKLLGSPILHSPKPDSYVWDIKTVKNTKSNFVTHSELAAEAELHTDSAFSDNPEDYFCLYSIKKADCNGGESLLLSMEDLLNELRKTEEGLKAEKQLRTKKYPFAVPSVFKEGHKSQDENLYAKDYILKEDSIRFRSDVIQRSLNIDPQLIDDDQYKALDVLQNIVDHSKGLKRLMLEVGDLIIINNKTMLHGRTAFEDSDRHLLRVRMRCNEKFAIASY
jgi:alpha-ketoglutarate-dependent taurine dioxygenase